MKEHIDTSRAQTALLAQSESGSNTGVTAEEVELAEGSLAFEGRAHQYMLTLLSNTGSEEAKAPGHNEFMRAISAIAS